MLLDMDAPELEQIAHNLFSTAVTPEGGDRRWEGGVSFSPDACFAGEGFCYDCPPVELANYEGCPDLLVFKPYNASITVQVPSFDPAASERRLIAALSTSTSSIVEDLIWNGCGDEDTETPTLQDATDLAGSPTNAAEALGLVIASIIDSENHVAARGTIHVSAADAPAIYDHLDEVSGKLVTKVGHHSVIVGNYPSGTLVGHVGPVVAWAGDIEVAVAQDMQRSNNVFTARAWRPTLAVWHACTAVKQALP